jgi:hypothetical protein
VLGVRVVGVRTPGVRVPGVRVVLLLVMGLGLLVDLANWGVADMDVRLLGRLLLAFEGTPKESRLTPPPPPPPFAPSPTEEAEVDACDARFLTETEVGR